MSAYEDGFLRGAAAARDAMQMNETALRQRVSDLEGALAALVEAGEPASGFPDGECVTVFNAAMRRAYDVLALVESQGDTPK